MAILMECDNCHQMFKTYKCYNKRDRINRFCSKKCEGEFRNFNNSSDCWKGGYVSSSTGYRYISYKGGKIEEHRLVIMNMLGRKLESNEHVHHINKDKLDNRVENLKLTTNVEHPKYHKRGNTKVCAICGELKKHHARGLCDTCYHYELMKGDLKKYGLSKK